METTKKSGILPAIFFILVAVFSAYDFLLTISLGVFNFRFLLYFVVFAALAVCLIIGKKTLLLPICTGVLAFLSLLFVFSSSPLEGFSLAYALGKVKYFLELGVWGLLTFLLLIDILPALETFKDKKTLLGKIFLILFIAFAGVCVLSIILSSENFQIADIIKQLIQKAAWLIAIFTLALWLSPAPQKEVAAHDHSSAPADSQAEFYVSMGKHVCLLLFTFGIWLLIWIYKVTKFSNFVTDEPASNPVTKLLLCLFVPFYQIYWTYKTATRIDKIAKAQGKLSDLATVCLILAIFVPIIPPILMQDKINQIMGQA